MSPNPTHLEYEPQLSKEKIGNIPSLPEWKKNYRWGRIIMFLVFHIQAVYGIYAIFTNAKILTNIFTTILYWSSFFCVTAGAHRLWSHRAYKATWQLKLLLMIGQTLTFQTSLYEWCAIHRSHHKYTDTDADPHNTKRGFFFSHIGCILVKSHPEFIAKRKLVDISDLKSNPYITFQKRYYFQLLVVLNFLLPTIIPWYFWNETVTNAWLIAVCLRYIVSLHNTLLVNSWSHFRGTQPYDTHNSGRDGILAGIITLGEGWHNYHHTFPWDYRASELSGGRVNVTTYILQLFAKIGWAYDLKTVSDETIRKRIQRTGDGSYSPTIWGWGDHEQTDENKNFVTIEHKKKLDRIY